MDKEQRRLYSQEYRKKNKDRLRAQASARYQLHKEKHLAWAKTSYDNARLKRLQGVESRRQKAKARLEKIALHYGCQNPACSWTGDFHPAQLQFHHLDPSQKDAVVSRLTGYAWEKIASEVNKCIIVCANCHSLHHWGKELDLSESTICRVDGNLEVITG